MPDNANSNKAVVAASSGGFQMSKTKTGGNNSGLPDPKPTVTIHGLRGGQTVIAGESAPAVTAAAYQAEGAKPQALSAPASSPHS